MPSNWLHSCFQNDRFTVPYIRIELFFLQSLCICTYNFLCLKIVLPRYSHGCHSLFVFQLKHFFLGDALACYEYILCSLSSSNYLLILIFIALIIIGSHISFTIIIRPPLNISWIGTNLYFSCSLRKRAWHKVDNT